jgi:glutaredoxin 3
MAEVKIYTKTFCGYCVAAKRLLDSKGVKYVEIDVSIDRDTRRWLAEATGQSTVPQTFINGESVGGYSDLEALDSAGKLDPMLAE